MVEVDKSPDGGTSSNLVPILPPASVVVTKVMDALIVDDGCWLLEHSPLCEDHVIATLSHDILQTTNVIFFHNASCDIVSK